MKRIVIYLLCFSVALFGVGLSAPRASAVKVSGYEVSSFYFDPSDGFSAGSRSDTLGFLYGYYPPASNNDQYYGFRIDIPPSSVPVILSVIDIYPSIHFAAGVNGFQAVSADRREPFYVFLSGVYNPGKMDFTSGVARRDYFSELVSNECNVFVPAHSSTLYLFGVCYHSGGYRYPMGAYSGPKSSITATPASNSQILEYQLNQLKDISGKLDKLASSAGQSAMDKFAGNYLDKFGGGASSGGSGGQIGKTEGFMDGSQGNLPNGGDVGGFASDIQNSMGIKGDKFNSQEYSQAVGGLSGSSASGDGGPWQFFTDEVANDMATGGGARYGRRKSDPMEELQDWIANSEGWLSAW